MYEKDKIEVKLEPFLQDNYESFNEVDYINKHLKVETSDSAVEAIEVKPFTYVEVQKFESKLSFNNLNVYDTTETFEEIHIKDEYSRENESCLYLPVDSNPSYVCNMCHYKTEVKQRFSRHLSTHLKEKSFVCNVCCFRTVSKYYLHDHMKIHDLNRKYFSCAYCKHGSRKKGNLKRHLEICKMRLVQCGIVVPTQTRKMSDKTNEKRFQCDQCEYSSAFKSALANHRKAHLEKVLKCDKCNYTTEKQPELSLHMMVHNGKEPYTCEICGYKAAFKQNIRRHVLKHLEVQPFQCSHCSYSTYRKHYLTSHMRVHTRKTKL